VGADPAMPSKNYDWNSVEKQRTEELLHLAGVRICASSFEALCWTFFFKEANED
jgi:hypothetical protein